MCWNSQQMSALPRTLPEIPKEKEQRSQIFSLLIKTSVSWWKIEGKTYTFWIKEKKYISGGRGQSLLCTTVHFLICVRLKNGTHGWHVLRAVTHALPGEIAACEFQVCLMCWSILFLAMRVLLWALKFSSPLKINIWVDQVLHVYLNNECGGNVLIRTSVKPRTTCDGCKMNYNSISDDLTM